MIRNNDLLFHLGGLLFHSLKIITCSRQWKDALIRYSVLSVGRFPMQIMEAADLQ